MADGSTTEDEVAEFMWVGINVAEELNQPTFWRASLDTANANGLEKFPFAKSIRDSTIEQEKQKGSEALPITWGPLPPDVQGSRFSIGSMGRGRNCTVPAALIGTMPSNYWAHATTNMYLHELPNALLRTILSLLEELMAMANHYTKTYPNEKPGLPIKQTTKLKRAQHATTSVLAQRDSKTASFLRRTDFVPMSYFKKYELEKLMP